MKLLFEKIPLPKPKKIIKIVKKVQQNEILQDTKKVTSSQNFQNVQYLTQIVTIFKDIKFIKLQESQKSKDQPPLILFGKIVKIVKRKPIQDVKIKQDSPLKEPSELKNLSFDLQKVPHLWNINFVSTFQYFIQQEDSICKEQITIDKPKKIIKIIRKKQEVIPCKQMNQEDQNQSQNQSPTIKDNHIQKQDSINDQITQNQDKNVRKNKQNKENKSQCLKNSKGTQKHRFKQQEIEKNQDKKFNGSAGQVQQINHTLKVQVECIPKINFLCKTKVNDQDQLDKYSNQKHCSRIEKNSGNQQTIQLQNSLEIEDEIQNMSYEEKISKLIQEQEEQAYRKYQQDKQQLAFNKIINIRQSIKKFNTNEKFYGYEEEIDFSEEDISDSIGQFYHQKNKKQKQNPFSLQQTFYKKIHTSIVNELTFLDLNWLMSNSCKQEAFYIQAPLSVTNALIPEEISLITTEQTVYDQEPQIQKIDLGEEKLSQIKFISPLSLLICVNKDNSIIIFKYTSTNHQIQTLQIFTDCHLISIQSWTFIEKYKIIVTDGQQVLKFWKLDDQLDTNNQSSLNDDSQNKQKISIHEIHHSQFEPLLHYQEDKQILYQAGCKKINAYKINIDIDNKNQNQQIITSSLLWTLDCSKQGVVQDIQVIQYDEYTNFIMTIHEKGKIVLWNIFNQNEFKSFQSNNQQSISQVYYNSLIRSYIVSFDTDDQLSSNIMFLDNFFNQIHIPVYHKNHKNVVEQRLDTFIAWI